MAKEYNTRSEYKIWDHQHLQFATSGLFHQPCTNMHVSGFSCKFAMAVCCWCLCCKNIGHIGMLKSSCAINWYHGPLLSPEIFWFLAPLSFHHCSVKGLFSARYLQNPSEELKNRKAPSSWQILSHNTEISTMNILTFLHEAVFCHLLKSGQKIFFCKLQYVSVVEVTKRGYPHHFFFLARGTHHHIVSLTNEWAQYSEVEQIYHIVTWVISVALDRTVATPCAAACLSCHDILVSAIMASRKQLQNQWSQFVDMLTRQISWQVDKAVRSTRQYSQFDWKSYRHHWGQWGWCDQ